jgi:hypothetical protein
MGLFSKKENNDKKAQMPPPPSNNSSSGNSQNNVSMTPPPVPGVDNTLGDIKSQVSGANTVQSQQVATPSLPTLNTNVDSNVSNNLNTTTTNTEIATQTSQSQETDDSLFDLSELDLIGDDNNLSLPSPSSSQKTTKGTSVEDDADFSKLELDHLKEKINTEEPIFITTSQFKSMLEIVESVKQRTKVANDVYLKLMDLKSEEDIEYENLRKSFQYFEEKLYEMDSLLFEK